MSVSLCVLSALLAADPVVVSASAPEITEQTIGGVVAPAVMPRGSTSLYAMLGAPDIGGGFRQGFSSVEFEARLLFNYLEASGLLEGGVRFSAWRQGIVELAPNLALGVAGNSGSTYYDRANFAYVALRPRAGLITTVKLSDLVVGIAQLDIPWAIALTNGGAGGQFTPTVGAGAEVHLGGLLSGLVMGQIGADVIKEPLGVTQVRVAWGVRLGLGFRLF